jgi:hypothetical protein
MTVQQRKHALIQWLTEVEDEKVIEKIETLQHAANLIPEKISQLLEISASSNVAESTAHTSIKSLLGSA